MLDVATGVDPGSNISSDITLWFCLQVYMNVHSFSTTFCRSVTRDNFLSARDDAQASPSSHALVARPIGLAAAGPSLPHYDVLPRHHSPLAALEKHLPCTC